MLDDFETDWQPPVPGRHTWWAPTILGMLVVSGACGGPREPEVPAAHGVAQHAPAPRAEEGEGEGGLAAASDAETTPNHTAKDTANVEPAPVDAAELAAYPPGTVTAIYMTSDGGLSLQNAFIPLSKKLPEHVVLVSADTATRLALEASEANSAD